MIAFLFFIFVGLGNCQLYFGSYPRERYDYLTIYNEDHWEKIECQCSATEFFVNCFNETTFKPMPGTDFFCFNMMCKYQIIFDQSCPDTYFSIFADYTFQKTTNILSISENVEPGSVSLFPSEIIFSSSANLSVKFDASYINDFDHQNKWKITFTPRPPPKKIQINLDTKTPYFLLWIDSMQSEEMMTICSGDGLEMEMEVRRANEDLSYIKFFNSTDMLGYVSSLNLEPGMQEFESFFSNHCFTIFQWYKPDGIGNKSFVLFKLLLDNQIIEINGNVKFESAANESHKITILSSNNPSSKNLQSVCISKFEATTPEAKYIFKNGFTGSPMLMLNGSVAEKYANFVFLTPALDIYIPPMAEMNVFCAAKCQTNASTFFQTNSDNYYNFGKNESNYVQDVSVYYELKSKTSSAANFVNLSTVLLVLFCDFAFF